MTISTETSQHLRTDKQWLAPLAGIAMKALPLAAAYLYSPFLVSVLMAGYVATDRAINPQKIAVLAGLYLLSPMLTLGATVGWVARNTEMGKQATKVATRITYDSARDITKTHLLPPCKKRGEALAKNVQQTASRTLDATCAQLSSLTKSVTNTASSAWAPVSQYLPSYNATTAKVAATCVATYFLFPQLSIVGGILSGLGATWLTKTRSGKSTCTYLTNQWSNARKELQEESWKTACKNAIHTSDITPLIPFIIDYDANVILDTEDLLDILREQKPDAMRELLKKLPEGKRSQLTAIWLYSQYEETTKAALFAAFLSPLSTDEQKKIVLDLLDKRRPTENEPFLKAYDCMLAIEDSRLDPTKDYRDLLDVTVQKLENNQGTFMEFVESLACYDKKISNEKMLEIQGEDPKTKECSLLAYITWHRKNPSDMIRQVLDLYKDQPAQILVFLKKLDDFQELKENMYPLLERRECVFPCVLDLPAATLSTEDLFQYVLKRALKKKLSVNLEDAKKLFNACATTEQRRTVLDNISGALQGKVPQTIYSFLLNAYITPLCNNGAISDQKLVEEVGNLVNHRVFNACRNDVDLVNALYLNVKEIRRSTRKLAETIQNNLGDAGIQTRSIFSKIINPSSRFEKKKTTSPESPSTTPKHDWNDVI
ncbi:MAG: hypothetical protein RLZZ453_923 [Chlamydiota bacterium]|jgi:hypothetical protein